MPKSTKRLDASESGLFQTHMKTLGVRPLHDTESNGAEHSKHDRHRYPDGNHRGRTAPARREKTTRAIADTRAPRQTGYGDRRHIEADDVLSFKGSGMSNREFEALRRGRCHVEQDLDLHFRTEPEASQDIVRFLLNCQHRGMKTVRIIHGKGLNSETSQPVLKSLVDALLRQQPMVLGFHSTKPRDGGTGAIYVRLKRNRQLRQEFRR